MGLKLPGLAQWTHHMVCSHRWDWEACSSAWLHGKELRWLDVCCCWFFCFIFGAEWWTDHSSPNTWPQELFSNSGLPKVSLVDSLVWTWSFSVTSRNLLWPNEHCWVLPLLLVQMQKWQRVPDTIQHDRYWTSQSRTLLVVPTMPQDPRTKAIVILVGGIFILIPFLHTWEMWVQTPSIFSSTR